MKNANANTSAANGSQPCGYSRAAQEGGSI